MKISMLELASLFCNCQSKYGLHADKHFEIFRLLLLKAMPHEHGITCRRTERSSAKLPISKCSRSMPPSAAIKTCRFTFVDLLVSTLSYLDSKATSNININYHVLLI